MVKYPLFSCLLSFFYNPHFIKMSTGNLNGAAASSPRPMHQVVYKTVPSPPSNKAKQYCTTCVLKSAHCSKHLLKETQILNISHNQNKQMLTKLMLRLCLYHLWYCALINELQCCFLEFVNDIRATLFIRQPVLPQAVDWQIGICHPPLSSFCGSSNSHSLVGLKKEVGNGAEKQVQRRVKG